MGDEFEGPFAKALSAWEKHYKANLTSLRKNVSYAMKLGLLAPPETSDPQQKLPPGWLMLPHAQSLTVNMQETKRIVEQEAGEVSDFIYISPKGGGSLR